MCSARELLREASADGRSWGKCPCCPLQEKNFPAGWWNFHVTSCMQLFFARHWAMKQRQRERYFDRRRRTRQFAARRAA